jgi:predicted enzyme related to lactoylglutathione lyase
MSHKPTAPNARLGHINLIALDWRALAAFYQRVFGCEPVPPQRDLKGEWLERGTGVRDAHLQGVHLLLPGHGAGGPTLEIYSYGQVVAQDTPVANRAGFTHIAFAVDDVRQAASAVLAAGGSMVGDIVVLTVEGRGRIEFAYVRDPEGNIIELQRWFTADSPA